MDDIPSAEDHLAQHSEYCRDLIAHRAPELEPADIVLAYSIPTESEDPGLSVEVVGLIVDAIDALEDKIEALERIVNGDEDEDDDDDEPGDQRQASGRN